MTTVYLVLGMITVSLLAIAKAMRWYNLPAVVEERRKRVEARQKVRTDRLIIRRRR